MELRNEIIIEASAERVWQALGERFMHVSEWAAPITASCPVGAAEPGVGVTRSCSIAPFGPVKAGVVKERLTRFSREAMAFEYEALEGMPSFVGRAVNRWSVTHVDDRRSLLRIHATLTLRGPMALLACAGPRPGTCPSWKQDARVLEPIWCFGWRLPSTYPSASATRCSSRPGYHPRFPRSRSRMRP